MSIEEGADPAQAAPQPSSRPQSAVKAEEAPAPEPEAQPADAPAEAPAPEAATEAPADASVDAPAEAPAGEDGAAPASAPPSRGGPPGPGAAPAVRDPNSDEAIAELELPVLSLDENGDPTPLPLPYVMNEETGKAMPLPGVESLFLTGTTIQIVELADMGEDKGLTEKEISKETLMKDIQFRGAISDFYVIKQKIQDADMDPLIIRTNDHDTYGDGNNFELVLSSSAVETVKFISEEAARRKLHARILKARADVEKKLPRSKRKRVIKPWISGGSEVEIEEASLRTHRKLISLVVQQPRRMFARPTKLADKESNEGWASNTNECRPFKDPNFDLRKVEVDVAMQAVPLVADAWAQASDDHPKPGSMQYQPQDLPWEEKSKLLSAPGFGKSLANALAMCEGAMVQNEVLDVFQDDFSALGDEDAGAGSRQDAGLAELQSFTDLIYSKNKIAAALQWLPHQRGFIAVAAIDALPYIERANRMGRPNPAYVLVWNFRDPIHPEYVMEAPHEVMAFQYNPSNPNIVAGGCYNGQVVIWDMAGEAERIAAQRQRQKQGGGDDEAVIPIVKQKYISSIEWSHQRSVADLQWLPGLEVTPKGKLAAAAESRECNFFATLGSDGKVMFWDLRVERLAKKKKSDEEQEWRAVHSIALLSSVSLDLSGLRLCFNPQALLEGNMYVTSLDGELIYATCIKPDNEENPDYAKMLLQPHAGAVAALQRSPFFNDLLLTVGDWTFQIWREGSNQPLFVSPYGESYYTSGCWSPSRPGVIFLGDESGKVEVWDLLDSSHEPSLRTPAASSPIVSMSFNAGQVGVTGAAQHMLAVGDATGVLHVMELPRNLRRPMHAETKIVTGFFETMEACLAEVNGRQAVRNDTLTQRATEARLKEEAAAAAKEAAAKAQQSNRNPEEEARVAAQKEYVKLERQLMVEMGLVKEDD